MKKLCFGFILIQFFITAAFAQMDYQSGYVIKEAIDFISFSKPEGYKSLVTLTEADIKGSPYLDAGFSEGAVFTTSKTQFVSVPLRYNIFNDQIEFKGADGQPYAISVPEVIEKVEIGEVQFEYIPYVITKKMRYGYFMVLEKGNASLYIKPKVVFEQAKAPGAYQDAQPARFVRRPDEYFIRAGMEPAKPVSKIKDLEDALPDHQKEVMGFFRKHRLKTGNPEDLKQLVQYYNQL